MEKVRNEITHFTQSRQCHLQHARAAQSDYRGCLL